MSALPDSALPAPPALAGLTWRPLAKIDVPAMARLSLACYQADGEQSPQPEADFIQIFDFLGDKVATDTLAAFTVAGEIAALGLPFVLPAGDEQRVNLNGSVQVAYRGRGLGSFILSWMEARARQLLADAPADLPKALQMGVRDHQQDRIDLLTAHGFVADRYFYRMERDLRQPLSERPLPPGLTLAAWNAELDESMRLAFNASFRDHYGFIPIDAEIWRRFFTGKETFRADLTPLAMDGDQVVGFCLSTVDAFRNTQMGRQEGGMEDINIVRAWRKRGVASALMAEAMRRYRQAGLEYAMLSVDTANPTGALGLYETLGFRAVRRAVNYCKRID